MARSSASSGLLTLAKVARAVERAFGAGSVRAGARGADACGADSEVARATFVRLCIGLVMKQRLEALGVFGEEAQLARLKERRKVRLEMAAFLDVDENEVFRLHHRAAGMRAKDRAYRKKANLLERDIARKYGLGL